MPKLSNRPPKPSRHKSGKNEYVVVYIDGKKSNLGRWGSPEAKQAYARFEVEWWENYRRPVAERVPTTTVLYFFHNNLQRVVRISLPQEFHFFYGRFYDACFKKLQ